MLCEKRIRLSDNDHIELIQQNAAVHHVPTLSCNDSRLP